MLRPTVPTLAFVTLAALTGCGGAPSTATSEGSTGSSDATGTTATTGTDTATDAPVDYEAPGPHPVGDARFVLEDEARGRTLQVSVWYPADASAADAAAQGHAIEEFVPAGPDRDQLVTLLADAHDPGTRRQTSSATDAAPAEGDPWPVIAFSHCHGCTRFSMFSIAERLASHGYAVVAPDHQGNTLFDALAGENAPLNGEFLATRAGDVRAVLDAVLDPENAAVPGALRGRLDGARVGVMGHSYGATTAGLVAQDDPRVMAALPLAAPIENPLLPGPALAEIHVPLLFVLAREDNSILEIGNMILRTNFQTANPPAWLLSVNDAGHWGFSDICGVTSDYGAGCGEGVRQTNGEAFTYLAPVTARGLAAAYATAFFDLHLRAHADASEYLSQESPEGVVEIEARQ